MFRKYIYFFVLVVVFLSAAWLAISFWYQPSYFPGSSTKVLSVAATIYPVADMIKTIGGDKVEVKTILPPGVSPHTFSPKPSDVKNLQDVKAIFTIGHGLDSWSDKLAASVSSAQIYQADKGLTLGKLSFESDHEESLSDQVNKNSEQGTDPHYWLSLANAQIMAGNIYEILSALDPFNQAYYLDNLKKFQQDLSDLQIQAQQKLASLTNRHLILFHESFNYLTAEFGLKVVGVFESAPGREPTPGQLKQIYDTARRYSLRAIFSEPQFSNDSLEPLLKDLNLKLFILDPLGGMPDRQTYMSLMSYNIDTIYEALRNN